MVAKAALTQIRGADAKSHVATAMIRSRVVEGGNKTGGWSGANVVL
jgi:hypothetical protein